VLDRDVTNHEEQLGSDAYPLLSLVFAELATEVS